MKKTGRLRPAEIVMLGTFGVWTRGTLQSRALPFARELASSRGIDVAIVTTPWDDPASAGTITDYEGVRIFNTCHIAPSQAPLAVAEQARLVRALRPSIVHLMKPRGFGGLAAGARRFFPSGCRLVVDCDDWEGDGGWNDTGQYGLLSRRLFDYQESSLIRSADVVTAASTLLDQRARRLRNANDDGRIVYLPNGLDPRWQRDLAEAIPVGERTMPVVLFYSRFAEFSHEWLQAFIVRLDREASGAIRLAFVGDLDPSALQGLQLANVELLLHGYLQRDRIPGILAGADVAAFPYQDTLINRAKQSVKLIELMASGRPVVATDVGDVARIAGDAVDLCPSTNPDAFARAVLTLLDDDERRRELASQARVRATAFTIPRLMPRLEAAYERAGLAA